MKFGVGQPMRRVEDARFLSGAGRYVDDVTLDGQSVAAFLRSPYAHAAIRRVDAAAARAAPGVLAVYTAEAPPAEGLAELANRSALTDAAPVSAPVLARDKARYVGQPVAMVVAESAALGRDALELIEVDYEALPAVVDARAALAPGAPQLHEAAPGNLAYTWETGDRAATAAAFEAARHIVSVDIHNQRVVVNPMEPRAVNAAYDADSARWTITIASQGAHNMRQRISEILGVEPRRLRILTPDVGGGFGMKIMIHPEYPLCAAAAQALGRPVKWTGDRSESFLSDAQGRDLHTLAEGAFDAEGRLLGLRFLSTSNLGASYSQFGAAVHTLFSHPIMGGMYRTPAAYAEARGAFTNTTFTDAYRGAGRPEVLNATERVMEAAARKIGLDPAEIRRRNLLTQADMPFPMAGEGGVFDVCDCVATLDRALEAADYAGVARRRAAAAARGRLFGVGVGYYMERTGGGPIENATIHLRANGAVEASVGTQSNGQGHETAWTQLIHEKLGVHPSAVTIVTGDSDLPVGGGTGGSRSLIMAHRVFFKAADDLIEKGRAIAAQELEAAPEDIEFSAPEGGIFRIAGTDRAINLFAVAARAEAQTLLGQGGVDDRASTYPNGAHVVEVEIDADTGWPTLTRYTIVDDFGTILNPLLVEGQVHGGVAQGVGQALWEGAVWDVETGQPQTGSFMDYVMPRALDLPFIHSGFNESAPTPSNPLGAKGCGEAGAVGATPATALAVLNALAAAGVPDVDALQMPYTPLKIWQALQTRSG